jgi:hypothetical protein
LTYKELPVITHSTPKKMDVKFDLVRIGKFRKNYVSETILKQNADLLRSNIRYLLKEENCSHKDNTVHMTMVIPGKGHNIKIVLQDVRDIHIKKQLKEKFPNSIYKGSKSALIDNLWNKLWRD